MTQSSLKSSRSAGRMRLLAILLMVLGAIGFVAALLFSRQGVLLQLGSTVVVFVGLALVLTARRQQQQGTQDVRRSAARVFDQQPFEHDAVENGSRGDFDANEAANALNEAHTAQPESAHAVDFGGLAGEVLRVYERKGAYVRVEANRPERSIVRVTQPDGLRATVLVLDSQEEVDLPEVRALFALVNEHRSARGYLVARGEYSGRARDWATTRGLKLLAEGELWMLAIGT